MPNYSTSKIFGICDYCKNKFRKKSFLHSFCSSECRYKHHKSKKDPLNLLVKNCLVCNKEFKTYLKIKKFCSKNCKNIYNMKKIRERTWAITNSKEIWAILDSKCSKCSKKANEIHHKTYKIPIRKVSKKNKGFEKMLKEYCKYLLPFCSSCHREHHKITS